MSSVDQGLLDMLRARRVRLAPLYGMRQGADRISGAAGRLGFSDLQVAFDEEIPSVTATIPAALQTFMADVRRELR